MDCWKGCFPRAAFKKQEEPPLPPVVFPKGEVEILERKPVSLETVARISQLYLRSLLRLLPRLENYKASRTTLRSLQKFQAGCFPMFGHALSSELLSTCC